MIFCYNIANNNYVYNRELSLQCHYTCSDAYKRLLSSRGHTLYTMYASIVEHRCLILY